MGLLTKDVGRTALRTPMQWVLQWHHKGFDGGPSSRREHV